MHRARVPLWPPQQHEIVPPINDTHAGFVREHHQFSWLCVPVMAWALAHGDWYSYFPGGDTDSIFPVIIRYLEASMAAAGVTDACFNADHYVTPETQEWVMAWRDNIGGQALSMYGHAIASLAGEQLRLGGTALQSRTEWVRTEHRLQRDPTIFQLLSNNKEMLVEGAYTCGSMFCSDYQASLNTLPTVKPPRQSDISPTQGQATGNYCLDILS